MNVNLEPSLLFGKGKANPFPVSSILLIYIGNEVFQILLFFTGHDAAFLIGNDCTIGKEPQANNVLLEIV